MRKLTLKQKLFVEHFLVSRDRVESARFAGFRGDNASLRVTAHRLLTNANVRAEIDRRLKPLIMSANQVLAGLTSIAESDIAIVHEADGSFDLMKAHKRGVSRLIKSISRDKDTGAVTKIEMYSAHEAQRDMGKYHQLFPTQVKFTTDDADKVIDEALEKHQLPKPEIFAGETMLDSEM